MKPLYWQLRHENWCLPQGGAIMGILNATPDSFSDGGLYSAPEQALKHAEQLIAEGADIIDIGGESTRPGADEVSLDQERARTIPLIHQLRQRHPLLKLSIDTRHAPIAAEALEAGVDIINDITGLADPAMRRLCAANACGIILMHMKGEPKTMQHAPQYQDAVAELRSFFQERLHLAQEAGIAAERICLDPGIGFGKTLAHNLTIIEHLEDLRPSPQQVMMMALSRKRFMGEILGSAEEGRSSAATLTMSLLSAQRGANIHRVHEVAPLKTALKLRLALPL